MSRPGFSLTLLGIIILSNVLTSMVAQSGQRVLIAFLVRNKAHSLPYFLHYIENLQMPKDQISLWIRADHNIDNSTCMLRKWVANMNGQYNDIDYEHDDSVSAYTGERGPLDWTDDRFGRVMRLKQAALEAGKQLRVDYLFMIDADVILTNPLTLQQLIDEDKPIVAPRLDVATEGPYSNFWAGQDDQGYYKSSAEYFKINNRVKRGCFEVPVVHSAILINYKHPQTKRLTYFPLPGYTGPFDDIIVFAHYAKSVEAKTYILNRFTYGIIPIPLHSTDSLVRELEQFIHIKTDSIVDDGPLQKVSYLNPPPLLDIKDKMGFDEIYFINLERRGYRKQWMEQCSQELGLDSRIFKAVDGKSLNVSYLNSLNIRMLPGYLDPYQDRPLTRGEVGCFLSHYSIWKEMLRNDYEKVLIFEDDVRFEPFFRSKFQKVLDEIRENKLEWDLIYLGRRRMRKVKEYFIPGSQYLVRPAYSYWAFAYMLSKTGVQKLMNQDPLRKMMAVDEYIPVMFDQHPRDDWKQHFQPRNLKAFSIEPFIVFPMRYTSQEGHVSDTDHSETMNFDSDGFLHEGEWPGVKNSIHEQKPGKLDNTVLRGDPDTLAEPKDEL